MTAADELVAPTRSGVRLQIRVTPRASANTVGGLHAGRLVVRVTAPPVDRAANEAVVRALAEALGIGRSLIQLVGGRQSRNKTVEITGVTVAEIRPRIDALAAGGAG